MTAVNLNRAVRGPVTAVPVVAGKGVRLVADTVNNRFVVEADETLLFEDSNGTGTNSGTLTEAYTNFERIRLEVGIGSQQNPPTDGYSFFEISPRASTAYIFYGFGAGGSNQYYACAKIAFSDPTTWSITHGSSIMHSQTSTSVSGNTQYNTNVQKCVVRIWGVNRIAST